MGWFAVYRRRLEAAFGLGWLFLREDAIDPFSICRGLPEPLTVYVLLVRRVQIREILHVSRRNDADIVHKPCHGTSRVSSPRETKAEDLISRSVVEDEEIVGLDDVSNKADPKPSLAVFLRGAEISRADAGIVIYELLPDLVIFVSAAPSN